MGGWSKNDKCVLLSQDVALFHTPWAFNISNIRPDIQRATTHLAGVCSTLCSTQSALWTLFQCILTEAWRPCSCAAHAPGQNRSRFYIDAALNTL